MMTSENQRQIKFKPRIKAEPQHIRCSLIYRIDFDFGGSGCWDRDVYYAKRVPFHGNVSTLLSIIV